MRGLTLTQPFASLVALGTRTIETRSWSTRYRGPLLIHAAQGWKTPEADSEWAAGLLRSHGRPPGPFGAFGQVPRGKIVARCELVACHPAYRDGYRAVVHCPLELAFGDFSEGRFLWMLEDVEPVDPPIPFKGMLGLWRVPEDLERLVCGPPAQLSLF